MRQVSVVIPSYEHARFVAEAIASVAAQARPALELVVVDDGSRDGSPAVVRRAFAAAPGLRAVLIEQEHRGAHAALARGIAASSGEVVAILNSDDRFGEGRLERLLAAVPARGDFLAFSGVRMIDATGMPHAAEASPVLGYRHALYEASRCPTVGFALLRNNIAVTSGNLVFTRSLYEKIGGFAPFQLAHDWDFLLQALVHVEPVFVPEPLLDYRTHGANTRLSLPDVVDEEGREILRRYLARCEEEVPANRLAPCAVHWPVYFDLFVSRYHAWFGQGPLRDWMEPAPPDVPPAAGAWRPWADAVDLDRVDDCLYLVDPEFDPARRDALAVARDVLISESHPLLAEEGAGTGALREVFGRQAGPMPRLDRRPWASPIDRTLAAPSPRAAERTARKPARSPAALLRGVARRPASALVRHLRDRYRIRRAGLFDAAYYRAQGRALGIRVLDPLGHYLRSGASRGLDPHPMFQTRFYAQRNPDVAGRRNPLVHYLLHGDQEGRAPHPGFDPGWYRAANPDVARSGMNTLSHFVRHGAAEGRSGHPRFDAGFYRAAQPGAAAGNPFHHYVHHGPGQGVAWNRRAALRVRLEAADAATGTGIGSEARARTAAMLQGLRRSGLFDASFYQEAWGTTLSDLGDAARHFLEQGAVEGVAFCPGDRLERRLRELEAAFDDPARPELALLRAAPTAAPVTTAHRVTLYVSSHGNGFFLEMAELLAHGFRRAGATVRIADERGPAAPREGPLDHAIIVAPHEFFLLGEGPERLSRELLGRSSLWVAEQPGSEFFAMCVWFARFARQVLDGNPLTALVWGALGVPARALPLGWDPAFADYQDRAELESPHVRDALEPAARAPVSVDRPLAERPLDLFFNGVLTARRERFFARHAWLFAAHRCALYMPTPQLPISARIASSLGARDATALAQRARLHLNVHRGDLPYFEWHRLAVRGFWQKTVVVSEPSFRVPGFEPGVHYLECELEEMPRRIEWLLHTAEGRAEAEAMRTRAYETLRTRYPARGLAAAFLAEEAGR